MEEEEGHRLEVEGRLGLERSGDPHLVRLYEEWEAGSKDWAGDGTLIRRDFLPLSTSRPLIHGRANTGNITHHLDDLLCRVFTWR